MQKIKSVALGILATMTCFAPAVQVANAATILWTLDVKFDDGASAIGTFSSDSTTGFVSETDFNVSTSNGLLLPAVYNPTTSVELTWSSSSFTLLLLTAHGGPRHLDLVFADPLTEVGSNLIAPGSTTFECNQEIPQLCRYIVGGEAVGVLSEVPLPGALPLFVTGLAGIGFFTYRRKRKQAV